MTPDSDIIKPERRNEWKRAIKACYNFSKHADNDPTNTVLFNAAVNEHIIFEAILIYSFITKETRPILLCFHMWMLINESVWFKKEAIDRFKVSLPIDDFKKFNKSEFFNGALPIITKAIGYVHKTSFY